MESNIQTWKQALVPIMQSPEMLQVKNFVQSERQTKNIYPDSTSVFRAFDMCPLRNTKVVILGQDPYHTPGTADGLAFSSKKEIPPSLKVIFKEAYRDLNIQYFYNMPIEDFFPSGKLDKWAEYGFLLLNTSLTVEEGKPGSHKDVPWSYLIENVIKTLNGIDRNLIFLLWGAKARSYKDKIDARKHIILEAAHPAAELHKEAKGGFYNSRHFSIVRDILPTLNKNDVNTHVSLNAFFDKEQAKKMVKSEYPIEADKIIDYIDNEMMISAPVNKEKYYEALKKFDLSISTKIYNNDKE